LSQQSEPRIINGWKIYAHALFLEQLETLITEVKKLQRKHPQTYQKKKSSKLLAAIIKLAFDSIPQDPTRIEYRQGDTLGEQYKHWFRAKFFQQYRLFFRFNREQKIIVYAWVNDENSQRAYESNTDAYRVFQKMLNKGNPPNSWQELVEQSQKETARFNNIK
jgi:toxin YhaV